MNSYEFLMPEKEVDFGIDCIAVEEILFLTMRYRDELNRLMNDVTEKNYDDPGDKVEF